MSDLRASSAYRLHDGGNLLRRFFLQHGEDACALAHAPMPCRSWTAAHDVGTAQIHDSAPLHVSGQAQYCDDIVLPANALHAASA